MKRILSLSLVLMMVLSLFAMAPITVSAATVTGGTEENPYLITQDNVADLYGNTLTGYFKLDDDITIDNSIYNIQNGGLDGDNNTVTLNITSGPAMFNTVGGTNTETVIKNLNIKGTVNTTGAYAGSLISLANAGTITVENVKNEADVISSNQQAGGIIGRTNTNAVLTTITNCENHGNVSGTNYLGGIVGYVNSPTVIENTRNYGNVTLGTSNVYGGGLVGCTFANLDVTNCANYGTIKGDYVTGLFSENQAGTTVKVSKSFNAGEVYNTKNNTDKKGHAYGLIYSYQNSVEITDCFNVGPVYNTYNNEKTEGGFIVYKGKLSNIYNTFKGLTTFQGSSSQPFVKTYTIEGTSFYGEETYNNQLQVVTADELKALAETLGNSFETLVPTKENAYPYPQIVGNPYVKAAATTPDTLGATGEAFPGADLGTATFADGEKTITGKYLAAFGIAPDKFGWEKSYGIEITTSEGVTYTAEAVKASATDDGHYGVLFYGPALTEGTYTIKPYAVYEGYGEENKVYGEEKVVTVD